MKTDQQPESHPVFFQKLTAAVSELKNRLQHHYEQAYPGLGDIIRLVLDEEETNAWELSPFAHLFLPDLVEAHIAELGLEPAATQYDEVRTPSGFGEIENHQLFPALCGSQVSAAGVTQHRKEYDEQQRYQYH